MLHVVTDPFESTPPRTPDKSDVLNSPSSSLSALSHSAIPRRSPLKMSIIGSPNSSGRFKKRQAASDFRSHHWSYLFETLRRTVDAIYEMCRADRSESECKEAMMILKNSAKDFQSLIDCFNVEDTFDQNKKKTAVAWEIRKTVGSPNKLISHSTTPGSVTPFPMNSSAVRELKLTDDAPSSDGNKENQDDSVNRLEKPIEEISGPLRPAALELPVSRVASTKIPQLEVSESGKNKEKIPSETQSEDDGWNLVKSRKKSRKRVLMSNLGQNVGVATSSAGRSVAGAKVMYPRSAMDIPQTRASMAKMAYSRRLLWEKKQCEYRAKFMAQQKAQHHHHPPKKSGSFPSISKIGINFADPQAVTQSARALKHSLEKKRLENAAAKILAMNNGGSNVKKSRKSGRFPKFNSCDSQCSLESIREETADGLPKEELSDSFSGSFSPEEESVLCSKHGHPRRHRSVAEEDEEEEDEGIMIDSSRSLPLDLDRQSLISLAETNEEEAWQHLTEEEESLAQEEESLQKEIEEEERKAVDDEVAQIEADELEEEARRVAKQEAVGKEITTEPWQEIMSKWQVDCPLLPGVSWSELVEAELAEVRRPGQAAQMHEKLSSPSRKRNPLDTVKRHEERLAKAEEHRKVRMEHKAKRLKELSKRVEEVRRKRMTVVEIKKEIMDQRMEKAKENREIQIEKIKKKARDEEEKVHEIAFIKELEANNRRHDKTQRDHDVEQRIKSIQDERQKKVGEKAAREAAAEVRRKAAAEERVSRLKELAEKKRKRQEQVEIHKTEQETQRQQAAFEKAKEREDRIAEIRATQQANTEVLKNRIHQKQEESKRRHVENLEQIKLKASEMCLPKLANEVQLAAHIQSIRHQSLQLNQSTGSEGVITELPDSGTVPENDCETSQKLIKNKKKRQKIRQKLLVKGREFEEALCCKGPTKPTSSNQHLSKLIKNETDFKNRIDRNKLEKIWPDSETHAVDKAMGEIGRLLPKIEPEVVDAHLKGSGISEMVPRLMDLIEKGSKIVPDRTISRAAHLLESFLDACPTLCSQVFFSSQILTIADLLAAKLKEERSNRDTQKELTVSTALNLFMLILKSTESSAKEIESVKFIPGGFGGLHSRSSAICSYLAFSGATESLCGPLREALEEEKHEAELSFLCVIAELAFVALRLTVSGNEPGEKSGCPELCGLELIRCMLDLAYHFLVGSRLEDISQPDETLNFTEIAIDILNFLATNSRSDFEDLATQEVTAFEILQLSSALIAMQSSPNLRHKAILLVGHFAAVSSDAQALVKNAAGGILEQLCILPFAYFSDPQLTAVLFPTLIVVCLNSAVNQEVLEMELSGVLLAGFIEDELKEAEKVDAKPLESNQFALQHRLPQNRWKEACQFFMDRPQVDSL